MDRLPGPLVFESIIQALPNSPNLCVTIAIKIPHAEITSITFTHHSPNRAKNAAGLSLTAHGCCPLSANGAIGALGIA